MHQYAGGLPAIGNSPRRYDPTTQRAYWRHTVAELHTGASVLVVSPSSFTPPAGIHGAGGAPLAQIQSTAVAQTGPQAVGERWDVRHIQVQASSQIGLPPLVVQQVAAQQSGTTTAPPPPIACRIWRAVGGLPVHLLAFTNNGGYDTVGVDCPTLTAGESVLVVWYGAAVGDTVQVIVRGTKFVLGT